MRALPVKPKRVMPGDTIGVVAPASSFDRQRFNRGVSVLESLGFNVFVPEEIYSKNGYLAGSDEARARSFQAVFQREDIQVVMTARGGFGSLKIADKLDVKKISLHSKIFVGFSDITALLSIFQLEGRMVVFHGPTVSCLSSCDKETLDGLVSAITATNQPMIHLENSTCLVSGAVRGPLTGGNLTTLCHLLGTRYHPMFKNHILLLEDRGEAIYRIDRMLTQMKMARCFDGVVGLLLGSFRSCGDRRQIISLFLNHFHNAGFPILSCEEIGHGKTNLTLPMGTRIELDAARRSIEFLEPFLLPRREHS